jgi:hypothetical protein
MHGVRTTLDLDGPRLWMFLGKGALFFLAGIPIGALINSYFIQCDNGIISFE